MQSLTIRVHELESRLSSNNVSRRSEPSQALLTLRQIPRDSEAFEARIETLQVDLIGFIRNHATTVIDPSRTAIDAISPASIRVFGLRPIAGTTSRCIRSMRPEFDRIKACLKHRDGVSYFLRTPKVKFWSDLESIFLHATGIDVSTHRFLLAAISTLFGLGTSSIDPSSSGGLPPLMTGGPIILLKPIISLPFVPGQQIPVLSAAETQAIADNPSLAAFIDKHSALEIGNPSSQPILLLVVERGDDWFAASVVTGSVTLYASKDQSDIRDDTCERACVACPRCYFKLTNSCSVMLSEACCRLSAAKRSCWNGSST